MKKADVDMKPTIAGYDFDAFILAYWPSPFRFLDWVKYNQTLKETFVDIQDIKSNIYLVVK